MIYAQLFFLHFFCIFAFFFSSLFFFFYPALPDSKFILILKPEKGPVSLRKRLFDFDCNRRLTPTVSDGVLSPFKPCKQVLVSMSLFDGEKTSD